MSTVKELLSKARAQERLVLAAGRLITAQPAQGVYLRLGLAAMCMAILLLIPMSGAACSTIL